MIPIKNQPTSDESNHPQSELPNDKNQTKPDESGIIKRNQDDNKDQDELVTTVKKIEKDDLGVENSTPVGSNEGKQWTLRTELRPLRHSIASVLSPNYSSMTSSLPSSTTDSHSSSISVELALELLNLPISNEDDMNAERIVKEIREWLSLGLCSQEFFPFYILNVDEIRFDDIITYPQAYFSLASGRKLFVRMYNWLRISEASKMKILTLDQSTKIIKLEDYSVDQQDQQPVGGCDNQERGVTGELNNVNRPMPSSSPCSPVSPSLSLPTSSSTSSMSAEQARELLSTPIPDNVYLDTKDIARQMKEWFTLGICTQSFFAAKILGTPRNRFHTILTTPLRFKKLRNGKELYIKMYNWLKMSEDVKREIWSVAGMNDEKSKKIVQEPEGEEEEYECPTEISKKREVSLLSETSPSITAETFNAIINKKINYVNTKNISILMKNWLQRTQATQRWFAKKILGRSRKTLGQCLNKPKDWKELSQKRKIYVKMYNWMCLTEEQRLKMMKVYKAPNMKCQ
ncbi:hypothetical protein GCK72_012913 [Caenorhabditis remanei]|uniref:CUT domain-containing protein n=1 Tax=Caenorhabditis remanei TaxID=31234 RepID=A0A6A5GM86_CAERE|nr:hypothetical protein GCK72_012913 [Caenorhabditis remanei]KAF1756460.1 hypothetical protein GCK72_012913 [Caenorhabditis remanei]